MDIVKLASSVNKHLVMESVNNVVSVLNQNVLGSVSASSAITGIVMDNVNVRNAIPTNVMENVRDVQSV